MILIRVVDLLPVPSWSWKHGLGSRKKCKISERGAFGVF